MKNYSNLLDMADKYRIHAIVNENLKNSYYIPKNIIDHRRDVILLGKNWDNTVAAHEIGHGLDKSLVSSVAPHVNYAWDKFYLPIAGTLGAIAASRMYPEYRNTATAINLGLQALSMVPTLYSEYTASEKAKDIYPKANSDKLNDMLLSHAKYMAMKRLLPAMAGHTVDYLI